jgi:hypothetical protein
MSAFRFEADATVIDLTIDMSEALSGFGGRFRAISAKANLTVDGCTFIGNGSANNTRAIIFGEGAGANVGNVVVSITDSKFIGWRRAISDNENAQDAKAVTITGNTIEDANVGVSAAETVVFNNNTVTGGYVNITSYASSDTLSVTAQGNTLTEKSAAGYNIILQAKTVNAQDEFMTANPVAAINGVPYETLAEALAAANAGDTLTFLADITEDVTVSKAVTIDGAGETYGGAMTLKAVTFIKNVNFSGKGYNGYAITTRGANYLTIEGCTAKNYGYGFIQLASGTALTTVKKVTVSNMNYGVKVDYSNAVVL